MQREERLLEADIKAMVLNHLKTIGYLTHDSTVINEFTLKKFSRRADLAIATQKHFIAFEIKSQADSLNRLAGQTNKYLEYFDKVIIAASAKHINKIIEIVPKNVEIWEVSPKKITIKQRGKIILIKDKKKLLELMNVNELTRLANTMGTAPNRRKKLEKELMEQPIKILRAHLIKSIKKRFYITSSLFWNSVYNKEILPTHIELLSAYKKERDAQKVEIELRNSFWGNSDTSEADEDPQLSKVTR